MRLFFTVICVVALALAGCGNEDNGTGGTGGGTGGAGATGGTGAMGGGSGDGCDGCIGVNIAGPGFPVDPVVSCEPSGEFTCACVAESGETATLSLEPGVGCIF
ncbi:MAG: hypothetical protein AAGF92_08830 [Myxococcota bacterium]